jgi:hypothetical protein
MILKSKLPAIFCALTAVIFDYTNPKSPFFRDIMITYRIVGTVIDLSSCEMLKITQKYSNLECYVHKSGPV